MTEELFDTVGAKYSFENEEQQNAKLEDELGGKEKLFRIKIEQGANRYWLLPSFDNEVGTPWRTAMVHFNPYHICGRADWVAVPTHDGKAKDKTDGKFSNCPRCIAVWDMYDENVTRDDTKKVEKTPLNEEWGKWRGSNMSGQRGLIQVINLTPFYKKLKSGNLALDSNMVDKYWESFCKIMSGELTEKDLPEDYPEAVFESAMCGPQVISLDKDTTKLLQTEYRKEYERNDETDPTRTPGNVLLGIDRYKTDSKYEGRDGQTNYKNGHQVSFVPYGKNDNVPDFKLLAKSCKSRIVNIHKPAAKFEGDELNTLSKEDIITRRAQASERLNDQDMAVFLEAMKFSVNNNPNSKSDSVGSDDDSDKPAPRAKKDKDYSHPNAVSASDPDKFDAGTVLNEDDMKAVEQMRAMVEFELED